VHSPGDPTLGGGVDPIIIFGNLGYALAGMILMFAGFLVFDKLTPRVNFADEIGKGNMAVAMIISALFVSLAIIIGRSLN
jgi:putative membrane protein